MFKFKLVRANKEDGSETVATAPQSQQLPFFNISSSPISRLKMELNTLNNESSHLGDDELWQRYSNIFQQYFTQNIPTKITIPATTVKTTKDDSIDLIPKAYKERARKLITLIEANINTQNKWTLDNVHLHENGRQVVGNFLDWIVYAMTTRKLVEPSGFSDFQRLLQDLNIPQSHMIRVVKRRRAIAVGNKRRRITSPLVVVTPLKSPKSAKTRAAQTRFFPTTSGGDDTEDLDAAGTDDDDGDDDDEVFKSAIKGPASITRVPKLVLKRREHAPSKIFRWSPYAKR
jgi:hypothetical protein